LNPWVTEKLSFENLGLVSDCQGDPEVTTVVVLGRTGTELAPSQGLGLLVGLLAAVGQTIRLWNVSTGRAAGALRGDFHGVIALAASPGGQYLAVACQDNTVGLWRRQD
jgi:WD40 repeat protein